MVIEKTDWQACNDDNAPEHGQRLCCIGTDLGRVRPVMDVRTAMSYRAAFNDDDVPEQKQRLYRIRTDLDRLRPVTGFR
ncbi:hypothetical protein Nepgr_010056 [Nepenthes gracilis]|uniref:Uncharacterized protein n=1 Tax=Nepenthes gracilis TaxID=150966 RepID=A0AAD3SC97_NEPGR|nr:hypothetical protein Nepgr_010056 [Nepenthes gracilis]